MSLIEPLLEIFTGGYISLRPSVFLLLAISFLMVLFFRREETRIEGELGQISQIFLASIIGYSYILISALLLIPILSHIKFISTEGTTLYLVVITFAAGMILLDTLLFKETKGFLIRYKEEHQVTLSEIGAVRKLVGRVFFCAILIGFIVLISLLTGISEPHPIFLINIRDMLTDSVNYGETLFNWYYLVYSILLIIYYAIALGIWEILMLIMNSIFKIHSTKIVDSWWLRKKREQYSNFRERFENKLIKIKDKLEIC